MPLGGMHDSRRKLECLIALKERLGEGDVAAELRALAERASFTTDFDLEVEAARLAHFAGGAWRAHTRQ
jgi:hypothetical protein